VSTTRDRAAPAVADPTLPQRDRAVGMVLLIAGLVGFVASFVLSVEKYRLLTNPFYTPSCSVNAVVSCGSVLGSPQSALFGFPNPYLGLAGFAVLAAAGAVLAGGSWLPGWFWAGLQAGTIAALILIGWLIGQSLFVIGALCPYCLLVWAATICSVWYVTLRNLAARADRVPDPASSPARSFVLRNHSSLLAVQLLAVAGLAAATVGLR
jgi:uncharacterized membrane protein